MLEFQNKRKLRKILYSKTVIFFLAVCAVLFIKAAWNVYTKERASAEYLTQTQSQINKLTEQKAGLSQSVATLGTPEGVEAQIRNKFRMVKNGESIAVIVDDQSGSSSLDTATLLNTNKSWWQRFTSALGF
jgi:cell division protein FtsB